MKNNKFIKSKILKIIDNLYKLSGRKEIPDVKKVCSEAKIDRQTAVKFLYAWWDKYYIKNNKKIPQLSIINNSSPFNETIEDKLLVKARACIECLSKEIILPAYAVD